MNQIASGIVATGFEFTLGNFPVCEILVRANSEETVSERPLLSIVIRI